MSQLRLEYIEAGSLAENPANWRTHPQGQTDALKELIGDPDIGWAGACLYNERTKRLIDGHARKNAVAPETLVPVLIGDWSEEAEKKILLTLDPLAGMAVADTAALESLLAEVNLDEAGLAGLYESLVAQVADVEVGGETTNTTVAPKDFKSVDENIPTEHTCPKCGYKFSGGK